MPQSAPARAHLNRPLGRWAVTLALGLATRALRAGCDDRKIDLRNLEAAMKARYGHDAQVAVESVTCPEWVRTREGDVFACELRFEGGTTWAIEVTQLEHGTTRWLPQGEAVYAKTLEPWLRAALAERGQAAEVSCDEPVQIVAPGETIVCHAHSGDGAKMPVQVVVNQEDGFRLVSSTE